MKTFIMALCALLPALSVQAAEHQYQFNHNIDSKYPSEQRTITVQLPESYYSQFKSCHK